MDTKSKQTQETYNEADLRAMKAEQLRKIASTLKISKIKTYKKDQLIKVILNIQKSKSTKFPIVATELKGRIQT